MCSKLIFKHQVRHTMSILMSCFLLKLHYCCLLLLMLSQLSFQILTLKAPALLLIHLQHKLYLHVLPFLRYTHRYKSSLWVSEFKQKKLKIKERACQENTLVTCPKLKSLKNNLNFIIMFSHVFLLLFIRF